MVDKSKSTLFLASVYPGVILAVSFSTEAQPDTIASTASQPIKLRTVENLFMLSYFPELWFLASKSLGADGLGFLRRFSDCDLILELSIGFEDSASA